MSRIKQRLHVVGCKEDAPSSDRLRYFVWDPAVLCRGAGLKQAELPKLRLPPQEVALPYFDQSSDFIAAWCWWKVPALCCSAQQLRLLLSLGHPSLLCPLLGFVPLGLSYSLAKSSLPFLCANDMQFLLCSPPAPSSQARSAFPIFTSNPWRKLLLPLSCASSSPLRRSAT